MDKYYILIFGWVAVMGIVHCGQKLETKTKDELTIENRAERSDLSGQ